MSALLLSVLLALPVSAIGADSSRLSEDHPLQLDLALDAAISLGLAVPTGFLLSDGVSPARPVEPAPTAAALSPFDRAALGRFDPGLSRVSDVELVSLVVAPFLLHAVESGLSSRQQGTHFGRRFGTDAAIYVEALVVNAFLTELIKQAVRRPRPFLYLDPGDFSGDVAQELRDRRGEADSSKSFPSGHSSLAFTAMSSMATLYTLKHPGDVGGIALIWVSSMALASSVALLRVGAGKHFPSDVIAGAFLGLGVGVVVPLLHRRRGSRPPLVVAPLLGRETRGIVISGMLPAPQRSAAP